MISIIIFNPFITTEPKSDYKSLSYEEYEQFCRLVNQLLRMPRIGLIIKCWRKAYHFNEVQHNGRIDIIKDQIIIN
jgi:hypothetical protein